MNFKITLIGAVFSLVAALTLPALSEEERNGASNPPAPQEERIVTPPQPQAPEVPELKEGGTEPLAQEPAPVAPPGNIAMLLPLRSSTYVRAAEAVRDGFMAAAQVPGAAFPLPVKIYEVDDHVQNLLTAYQGAVDDGARVVVGPITRNGVTALAFSPVLSVPTLGLSVSEVESTLPRLFYSLSLSQEAEARQLARIAFGAGQRRCATVSTPANYSKRLRSSFAQEWRKMGGVLALEFQFSAESKALTEFRANLKKETIECVFLALEPTEARRIRPYVRATMPVYTTSQIFRSKQDVAINADLRGIRFLDMPWNLKPDHTAVMVYPPAQKPLNLELQRFYALGIDAYRIAQLLLAGEQYLSQGIDGVTGRVSLGDGHYFQRELLPATFDANGAVTLMAQ